MITLSIIMSCSTRKIMGHVHDANKEPIREVTVQLQDGQSKSTSDKDGYFLIKSPMQAAYHITYIKPGYVPLEIEMRCPRRRCTAPTVYLSPMDLIVPYAPELLLPLLQSQDTETTSSSSDDKNTKATQ